MTAAELFEAGKLTDAVAAALEEVKKQPMEPGPRWRLVEFLLFAGDLERADKHLDTLLTQFPKLSMTAVFYRQLLRAEKARREVMAEGRLPDFLSQPGEAVQECLHALVSLRAGDVAEAARHVAQAEAVRTKTAGTCDGLPFDDLRDVDDAFGPILELVTADGRCAWMALSEVASLKFEPPQRARDLLWRHAELVARDQQKTQVLIPALYPNTHRESDDTLRLGRQTQWKELAPGLVQGLGQRLWLVGEDVRPILEIKEISFA
ncbi:MAG TPA: type VI secretion system accessory protein TagJ [Pirellulaceae bacterium]|nr:type VI secretion system accessory protein TagJ [Pirellulaceae bacterium]